jgi:hypothetical protein
MSGPQRAVHDRFEDPLMRELVKDMCSARTLRHDLYVRGARRLSPAARDAALRQVRLALAVPPEKVRLEVQVAVGKAELAEAFYRPVTEMLARGPASVGALLKAPGAVASRENPAELAGLLVGTRQAMVVARPDAPPTAAALRLNQAIAERLGVTETINRGAALASPMLGGGLPSSAVELFVAGRILAGATEDEAASWLDRLAGGLDEENTRRVAEALDLARDEALPLMRRLGCLPA